MFYDQNMDCSGLNKCLHSSLCHYSDSNQYNVVFLRASLTQKSFLECLFVFLSDLKKKLKNKSIADSYVSVGANSVNNPLKSVFI